jgi:hypothetical protein
MKVTLKKKIKKTNRFSGFMMHDPTLGGVELTIHFHTTRQKQGTSLVAVLGDITWDLSS